MNTKSLTPLLLAVLGLSGGGAAHAQQTIYAVANQAVTGAAGEQSYTDVRSTVGVTPPANIGSDGYGGGYLTTFDPTAPQGIFTKQMAGIGTNQPFVFGGLTPDASYTETLNLAEDYYSAGTDRTFGIDINGVSVLPTTFSIATAAFAQYGVQPNYGNGQHEAIAETFNIAADNSGNISVLVIAGNNQPLIGGIEISTPAAVPESSSVVPLGLLLLLGSGSLLLRARKRLPGAATRL